MLRPQAEFSRASGRGLRQVRNFITHPAITVRTSAEVPGVRTCPALAHALVDAGINERDVQKKNPTTPRSNPSAMFDITETAERRI